MYVVVSVGVGSEGVVSVGGVGLVVVSVGRSESMCS